MSSRNIPDWLSALVGMMALVGVGMGSYAGWTNALTSLETRAEAKHGFYDDSLRENSVAHVVFQQRDEVQDRKITVLEVKMGAIEKGQERLIDAVEDLAGELREMNAILIKLDVQQQGGKYAKEGGVQEER